MIIKILQISVIVIHKVTGSGINHPWVVQVTKIKKSFFIAAWSRSSCVRWDLLETDHCFFALGISFVGVTRCRRASMSHAVELTKLWGSLFSLANEEWRSKLCSAWLTPRSGVWEKDDILWRAALLIHLGYQSFICPWTRCQRATGAYSLLYFCDFNPPSWTKIYGRFLLLSRWKVYVIMLASSKSNASVSYTISEIWGLESVGPLQHPHSPTLLSAWQSSCKAV